MNRVLRVLLALTLLGMLWSALIGATMLLLPPTKIAAQPPPPKSPVPPTVVPPTAEPTEPTVEPTEPPEPTAAPPTEEPPTEEPPTEEPPTEEPSPIEPTSQPTARPKQQPVDEPIGDSEPDPNCRSVVEGYVANAAGGKVAGASVKVEGEGWSRGMMTDDNGHYGFGGLCASTATLAAVLPGGQASTSATISLDGKNRSEVDLLVAQGGAAQPTATVQATVQPETIEAAATPEPGMPSTGFPGWLLVSMAAMGALVILAVRMCRLLLIRTRDH